jgi:tetratricopeptide (TPR) repeat protein
MSDESWFLTRSLEDLEAERAAGDLDDRSYSELKAAYTARAAAPAGEAAPRRGPLPLLIALLVAFGVGAGLLVARSAGTRLPGDNISGSTPTSQNAKLDAQAQQQIQQGKVLDAIKSFDAALKVAPNDPVALAYKGWLIRLAGTQAQNPQLIDLGLASIRRAEQVDPGYPDAHFFAGETLLRDKKDPKGAITEFEQFLADNPPSAMVPEVQGELQSARAAAAP